MKLPFEFATKLILRLVLPGALLTALFWPLLMAGCRAFGVAASPPIVVPVAILGFGWLVLLLDMPLYMAMEGRRFWPARLRRRGIEREKARLARWEARRAEAKARGDDSAALEAALKTREFPLDDDGEPEARYPTRLGNLVTAFETYPDRKYGLDGTFAWTRIWVSIDKDLRGELDDRQAVVDSALYASFVLLAAFPLCLGYAVAAAVDPALLPELPGSKALVVAAFLLLAAGYGVYRVSAFAHMQYGELFAALFDQNVDRIDPAALLLELGRFMDDPEPPSSPRERRRAWVRFLKWHRYRRSGESRNEVVRRW